MNLFNYSGDIYGSSRSHSPSVKNHLRPLNYDLGADSQQHHVRLDHVRPAMGESGHTSDICRIQLSYSQHPREDTP